MSDPDSQIIRFSTTMIRRKGRNLLRDPRSAIHVPGPDFFNFAVAAGTAAVAVFERPDDEAVDELFSIHSGLGATSDRDEFGEQMLANHRMAVDCTSIVSTARSSTGQTKGTHD